MGGPTKAPELTLGIIIGVVAGLLCVIVVVAVLVLLLMRRRQFKVPTSTFISPLQNLGNI